MQVRRHVRAAATLAATLSVSGTALAAAPAPAPYEPVRGSVVPLPAEARDPSHPDFTPDGGHVVFGFDAGEQEGEDVGVAALDGTGFRCLTCGLPALQGPDRPLNAGRPLDVGKPFVFQDGRRVLIRQPGREDRDTNEVGDFNYGILECAPSLVRCDRRAHVPVELPTGGLTRGTQNREGRISYDGRFLAFTAVNAIEGSRMVLGRLVREAGRYVLADARVLDPPHTLGDDWVGWATAGPLYEFKRFSRDGRTVTYAGSTSSLNFDTYELDLVTGQRRRISFDDDWDEDAEVQADGDYTLRASAIGLDRMDVFSQLPRPPFLDSASFVQVGRYMLRENRGCLLEPWLTDRAGERGTYAGQPLNLPVDRAWSSHPTYKWSPDGTGVLFWERRQGPRAAGDPATRLKLLRLPARRPSPPRIDPTPVPAWAPSLAGYDGPADEPAAGRVLRGPGGGTATLDFSGTFGTHVRRVTYAGWSEDGRTFLDGVESVRTPLATNRSDYDADLDLRGARSGSMRTDLTVVEGGRATGTVRSTVDGRTLEGLPTKADCPGLPSPELRVGVRRGRALSGGRRPLVVTVSARVVDDPVWRPVRAARVRVLGGRVRGERRRALTDRRGRAVLRVTRRGRRATTVVAYAEGFGVVRRRVRDLRR